MTLHHKFLKEEQGNKCFFCGHELSDENISLEHLVPRSMSKGLKGVFNNHENYVLMCRCFNNLLGSIPLKHKLKVMLKFSDIKKCPEPNDPKYREVAEFIKRNNFTPKREPFVEINDDLGYQFFQKLLEIRPEERISEQRLKSGLKQICRGPQNIDLQHLLVHMMNKKLLTKTKRSPKFFIPIKRTTSQSRTGQFWLSSGGTRHNRDCRLYKLSAHGKIITDDRHGIACSRCGG